MYKDPVNQGKVQLSSTVFGHAVGVYGAGADTESFLSLSVFGLAFGAGGTLAPDWIMSRSAANVARLASGDFIRAQTDPSDDEDLSRKAYVDAGDAEVEAPTVAAYDTDDGIAWSDRAADITVDDTWEPSLSGAQSGRLNQFSLQVTMSGAQTITWPTVVWVTDSGSAPTIGDGDEAAIELWQFSDDGTVFAAAGVNAA